MNTFKNLFQNFQDQKITKQEYIDQAYQIHSLLFQYASWLPETDIKHISISDEEVKMTLRDHQLSFKCLPGDKRLATIDMLNFKTYEKQEIDFQVALIGHKNTVLDIGANYGWYALQVASQRPDSKVLSFEPIPATFQALVHNIIENKISNVMPYNMGLSDREEVLDFYIDATLSVNASLQNVSESTNAKKISCITRTLDQFVLENNLKIDFIKCDVEGAELLVFKGGENIFKSQQPIVFTEMLRKWSKKFNYHPNDIIHFFKLLGYKCYKLSSESMLEEVPTVTDSTIETNFFFLHATGHIKEIKKYVRS